MSWWSYFSEYLLQLLISSTYFVLFGQLGICIGWTTRTHSTFHLFTDCAQDTAGFTRTFTEGVGWWQKLCVWRHPIRHSYHKSLYRAGPDVHSKQTFSEQTTFIADQFISGHIQYRPVKLSTIGNMNLVTYFVFKLMHQIIEVCSIS